MRTPGPGGGLPPRAGVGCFMNGPVSRYRPSGVNFAGISARLLRLASQTLAEYLTEDGSSNLHPYVIGMDWRVNAKDYGHVIVARTGSTST